MKLKKKKTVDLGEPPEVSGHVNVLCEGHSSEKFPLVHQKKFLSLLKVSWLQTELFLNVVVQVFVDLRSAVLTFTAQKDRALNLEVSGTF